MCTHVVKLGWGTRTNLYTTCTMSWYIAAELQYSRNEVHVMMAPPVTVTRAQYVASTEDIAPVMTALMFRCTMYVLCCLHDCFSPGNNMGIIQNHVGNNQGKY